MVTMHILPAKTTSTVTIGRIMLEAGKRYVLPPNAIDFRVIEGHAVMLVQDHEIPLWPGRLAHFRGDEGEVIFLSANDAPVCIELVMV